MKQPTIITVAPQTITAPCGTASARVAVNQDGSVHLADVTFYPPWWRAAWVHVGLFVAGFASASLLWGLL